MVFEKLRAQSFEKQIIRRNRTKTIRSPLETEALIIL